MRSRNMEQLREYGTRVGIWRLLRLFLERGALLTVRAVGCALELNSGVGAAIAEARCDTVCHQWRWIDYHFMDHAEEAEHIARNMAIIERLTGVRPLSTLYRVRAAA